MAQRVITQEGVFDHTVRAAINNNFSDLFGTEVGGSLEDAHIMVGSALDVATPVEVSGDAELANDGAATVVGLNGSATSVTGAELTAAEAIIAAIPTVDPEDGETIWNDGGVLKVASAP